MLNVCMYVCNLLAIYMWLLINIFLRCFLINMIRKNTLSNDYFNADNHYIKHLTDIYNY